MNRSQLILSPFHRQDADRLISWIPDAEFMLQWAGPQYQWPLTRTQIELHVCRPGIEPFMVLGPSAPVGYIELCWEADEHCRLCKILVADHEKRGLGLGRKIIQQTIALIHQRNSSVQIFLNVFSHNEPAFRCYKSLGFEVVAQQQDLLRMQFLG